MQIFTPKFTQESQSKAKHGVSSEIMQ